MNKTPDLSAIMDDYTQQVRAEEKRRQQVRDFYAKWEATRPQGIYGTWNISDRD